MKTPNDTPGIESVEVLSLSPSGSNAMRPSLQEASRTARSNVLHEFQLVRSKELSAFLASLGLEPSRIASVDVAVHAGAEGHISSWTATEAYVAATCGEWEQCNGWLISPQLTHGCGMVGFLFHSVVRRRRDGKMLDVYAPDGAAKKTWFLPDESMTTNVIAAHRAHAGATTKHLVAGGAWRPCAQCEGELSKIWRPYPIATREEILSWHRRALSGSYRCKLLAVHLPSMLI
eukprot:1832084-Prymnesium_polylepis.4